MSVSAEVQRRNKSRRKARGVCLDCTKRAEPGRVRCREHLAYHQSYYAKNREAILSRAKELMSPEARREYLRGPGRFSATRRAAIKRFSGLMGVLFAWDLTREQYEDLVSKPCHYCGFKIETVIGGLDRLDNSKGYIFGNVVPCCFECNVARSDHFSPDEMLVIGAAIRSVKLARGRS